jgi:hypothetical protein
MYSLFIGMKKSEDRSPKTEESSIDDPIFQNTSDNLPSTPHNVKKSILNRLLIFLFCLFHVLIIRK